jgi:large subunit ribosomal protein L21
MYAIVDTGGKQAMVSPGALITVDRVAGEVDTEVVFDKVLMVCDGDKTVFGTPYIEGAVVKAQVVSTGKMRKVLVQKHVPKKAHEKLCGHRQPFTKVKIGEILGG